MSVESITEQIKKYKEEYENVKGTPTECYTRCVGYYRPIENFNTGKTEEYFDRKVFKPDDKECDNRHEPL